MAAIRRRDLRDTPTIITSVEVEGFKAIGDSRTLELRPLTVLAGANSSGKSSIMQPLLMLKQTLEVTYDPGPLLMNGPNVKFTATDQLLTHRPKRDRTNWFRVRVVLGKYYGESTFARGDKGIDLVESRYETEFGPLLLSAGASSSVIHDALPKQLRTIAQNFGGKGNREAWSVVRERCFLDLALEAKNRPYSFNMLSSFSSTKRSVEHALSSIIHLPGLRGNPERTYPVTAVGEAYPGTFDQYTASIINQWQEQKETEKLSALGRDLKALGLTWKVRTQQKDDTRVELRVGRLPQATRGGAGDMVNIADVGFGVSQTLPVVVALHAASPNQLVYLEQPEIHLHPRAQLAMAQVLVDAVRRGVRVVVETHSTLLLLGIQTLVAEGFDPELVRFHWLQRDPVSGLTEVIPSGLDRTGAFEQDWPEDFAEVVLNAEDRFLNAQLG
jgi:predicted ATPase